MWSQSSSAPSVGFPSTRGEPLEQSSSAVEFPAMFSAIFCSAHSGESFGLRYVFATPTCILFCVSVPVLSVQITVAAPIVSQACIFRTRLFVWSIRRME